jgi:hypothetical protein
MRLRLHRCYLHWWRDENGITGAVIYGHSFHWR